MSAATERLPATGRSVSPLAAARRRVARRRRLTLMALERLALGLVAVAILFPIAWMVLTAFKPAADVYRYVWLFTPTLDNFREVFGPRWQLGWKVFNSMVVACSTVAIAVPIAVIAAYGFSRFEFRGKRVARWTERGHSYRADHRNASGGR